MTRRIRFQPMQRSTKVFVKGVAAKFIAKAIAADAKLLMPMPARISVRTEASREARA